MQTPTIQQISVPQPKFAFGQKVVVVFDRQKTVYEPCPDCDKGSVKLKSDKSFPCPTCHGTGHSYKVESIKKWKEVVGELTIEQVHIELVAPNSLRTPFYGDKISPVAYQGSMEWLDKRESSNVFHESRCFATIVEAEDYTEAEDDLV
jgi:hypothetical protein